MEGRKKGVWLLGTLLLLLVCSVIGILQIKESLNKDKSYEIIYIPKTMDPNNDFWALVVEGIRMAAVEYGAEVTVVAPDSEEDYEGQNELIEWAVSCKPDAILLSPCSYTESIPLAEKIKEAGIPLIFVDSNMENKLEDALVATDNVKLGKVQGEFIKKHISENSQIAIIGHVKNSSTALEREKGIRLGLGEQEDKIVEVVFCDSSYEKSYELMMGLIEQHSEIDLVAGLNEYSAVGAARAIRDLGLTGQIKMFGTDSSLEEIQMLEEGIFEGIVIQNPFKMGYLGLEVTMRILKGEPTLQQIDSGCELVTKENIYTEEKEKLLFLFKEE